MFVLSLLLTGCFADFYDHEDLGYDDYNRDRPAPAPQALSGLFDLSRVSGVEGGLTLYEGGGVGIVGMEGVSCEVHTYSGRLDTDIVVDEERTPSILDGDGHHVLAASGERLSVFPRGGGDTPFEGMVDAVPELDVEVQGLITARLTDAGLIALRRTETGCALGWMGQSEQAQRDWSEAAELIVPEEACRVSSMSVDPIRGEVWLGVGEAMRMGPDGVLYTGVEADAVAWDPHAGLLYATSGRTLSVLDERGLLLESFDLDVDIEQVTHLGAQGAALLITVPAPGWRGLQVIDPRSGRVLAQRRLQIDGVEAVAASPDGSVLGIVSEGVAMFMELVL